MAFANGCFDFESCMEIRVLESILAKLNFSSRLQVLEWSTPPKHVHESGGCWLWLRIAATDTYDPWSRLGGSR